MKRRISDLCKAFVSCGYPSSMVKRISDKVLASKRDLTLIKKNKTTNNPANLPTNNVRIVSTFGTDDLLVNCVKDAIPYLQETNSFKNKNVSFKFVKKTAPSVGSKLAVLKKMSLGVSNAGTSKCGSTSNCQCCKVIHDIPKSKLTVNGKKLLLPSGNCKSRNTIYLAECTLCTDKCYVGRTVQPLHKRVNGHRQGFSTVVEKGLDYVNHNDTEDIFTLGVHLHSVHGVTSEFNNYYKFHVLEHVSPLQMEKSEHLWIHKLNTLFPHGINKSNPFALPILEVGSVT